jgi:hypothetical protein
MGRVLHKISVCPKFIGPFHISCLGRRGEDEYRSTEKRGLTPKPLQHFKAAAQREFQIEKDEPGDGGGIAAFANPLQIVDCDLTIRGNIHLIRDRRFVKEPAKEKQIIVAVLHDEDGKRVGNGHEQECAEGTESAYEARPKIGDHCYGMIPRRDAGSSGAGA